MSLLLVVSIAAASGQEMENNGTYSNIASGKYVRLCVDNDYFSGTDKQYTEGVALEYFSPGLKMCPLERLLYYPVLQGMTIKYGMGIEQEAYTPYNLKAIAPVFNDRPYASVMLLKTIAIATDAANRQRFATTLTLGVIGPSALGEDIQKGAHIVFDNVIPAGWKYQVHDDVVVNYQLDFQKQVYAYSDRLSADIDVMGRVGTLSDKTGAGVTLMAGKIRSAFSKETPERGTWIYGYVHPEVNFIGHDATLQGGVFNSSSPYTVSSTEIARTVFKNHLGLVMVRNNWTLECFRCFQSKLIRGGDDHAWNGIRVNMALK